jgi:hypothetical protein
VQQLGHCVWVLPVSYQYNGIVIRSLKAMPPRSLDTPDEDHLSIHGGRRFSTETITGVDVYTRVFFVRRIGTVVESVPSLHWTVEFDAHRLYNRLHLEQVTKLGFPFS